MAQAVAKGNFAASSEDIGVHVFLTATCKQADGVKKSASLNLDSGIGNEDGSFKVGGVNFSLTAANVVLDGTTLKASLQKANGEYNDGQELDLNSCITNENGTLKFV